MADKVIGKAAAALLALGGVREVFALVISLPARELLERAGIATGYSEEVPHIKIVHGRDGVRWRLGVIPWKLRKRVWFRSRNL